MKNPIARYLMCAYAYYEEDDPLMSDTDFDQLAKWLLKNYDNVNHFHKHLVTKGDLKAGTYLGKYPERVKGAVKSWRKLTRQERESHLQNYLKEQNTTQKEMSGTATLDEFFISGQA
jgi:NAD-dependent DNA ligase